jgi:serine/threonine protein kinase
MTHPHQSVPEPRVGPGALVAGRYRLDRRVGRGGMADVYSAEDELLGRAVAVKMFRLDATADDRHRIDVEMRTLAALRHPGLVTVFDAGTAADSSGSGHEQSSPFLVMELITGPTLAEQLREGPLTPADCGRIGAQLADTLTYVHSNNVVHRDVKPANILLDTHHGDAAGAESRFAVKLADFGISRVLDSTSITMHGTTVGTANYLSPEQARGDPVGPASDTYSLGLVLCECLTGQVVYPGSGIEAAIARLHRQPDIPAHIGPLWRQLLSAMTLHDPAARPGGAEVAATLASFNADRATAEIITPTSVTAVLDAVPPASTAILPDLPTTHANPVPNRVRRGRNVAVAALGAVLIAIIAVALASGGRSTAYTPQPAYPSVSGQVGVDLNELEGTLP